MAVWCTIQHKIFKIYFIFVLSGYCSKCLILVFYSLPLREFFLWDKHVLCVFCEPAQFFLSEHTLDVFGEKKTAEVFSWPKPFCFQASALAHSVGLYEGRFSSRSRMQWSVPGPSLRCSPSGTGHNHRLFRWHRVAQNAFIQITRFEVSSLINRHFLLPTCCSFLLLFLPPPPPCPNSIPANYCCSCSTPAGRLIVVNSLLWSLSQLVLQQVTRKPPLNHRK